jgi:hypothetical protein
VSGGISRRAETENKNTMRMKIIKHLNPKTRTRLRSLLVAAALVALLTAAGLLEPLGHPAPNSTKYFATENLDKLKRDEKWLARAGDAISAYWRKRNARRPKARGHAWDK